MELYSFNSRLSNWFNIKFKMLHRFRYWYLWHSRNFYAGEQPLKFRSVLRLIFTKNNFGFQLKVAFNQINKSRKRTVKHTSIHTYIIKKMISCMFCLYLTHTHIQKHTIFHSQIHTFLFPNICAQPCKNTKICIYIHSSTITLVYTCIRNHKFVLS